MVKPNSDELNIATSNLKHLLVAQDMKQGDLCPVLGLNRSSISMKMHGSVSFTTADLIKLADYFHVSTDYLLGREPMEVE